MRAAGLAAPLAFVVFIAPAVAQDSEPEPIVFQAARADIELVDADTFWMGIHPVRLHGIDTVEPDQTCRRAGAEVDCYGETVKALETFLSDPRFQCEIPRGPDGRPQMSYGRYIAVCSAGSSDVNRELVRQGWALAANNSHGDDFRALEEEARAAGRGLHALEYDPPWEFRRDR